MEITFKSYFIRGENLKQNYKNLAVFDLDGTLWKINSHFEILNAYFKTKLYTSFSFRLLNHFFKKKAYYYICKKYKEIPKEFVYSFEPEFNPEIISLLEEKKKAGFFCLILSNAPYEIAEHAAERLSIPFLCAPIGKKKSVLDENYSYSQLFVCTDNIDDMDLIKASTYKKIVFTRNNTNFFNKHGISEK